MRSSDSSPYHEPDEESILEWETERERRRLYGQRVWRDECVMAFTSLLIVLVLYALVGAVYGVSWLVVMALMGGRTLRGRRTTEGEVL